MPTKRATELHPSWLKDVVTASKEEVDAWPEWKKPSSFVRRREADERDQSHSQGSQPQVRLHGR